MEALKAMPKPKYKNKPIFPLIDPEHHRTLEDVFEKVDEDKQMGDDQHKQVSTETKAERKLRLKKAQLKKHLTEQKLGISKCKYLYSTVSWLRWPGAISRWVGQRFEVSRRKWNLCGLASR